ncbi:MAG: uracil-DNA glycosylase [SAR86 cluster bacterium]|jgi:uracil-DNA glycosylase|nr:uracil-DNA glycosylase [SAR86 cluster bacterium]
MTQKEHLIQELEGKWHEVLENQFDKSYMFKLLDFLEEENKNQKKIVPEKSKIFRAFKLCKLEEVRVVIIGQDPYPGEGQANGLAFSSDSKSPPPSLKNIHKEVLSDLGINNELKCNLESWAKQGVLLLNSILTTEEKVIAAHRNLGWEIFTDIVVKILNDQKHLVFLLWGKYASNKGSLIDQSRHLVLHSTHPSPLSAHRGFFGSKHFSKCNAYLKKHHNQKVDWKI